MNLNHLTEIAINAAHSAGAVIHKYRSQEISVDTKKAGSSYASQVITAVDKACERVILSHLLPTCTAFDIALLSEESEDDGSRFVQKHFWCIDPMDGTLAFINKYPGFSVSIALVAKDGTPKIGVVLDPSTNNLYHAIHGGGAFKNGQPWQLENHNGHLTYVTDRTLQDTIHAEEIELLLAGLSSKLGVSHVEELSGAGAVLNAIRVLENGPSCMLKFPKKELGGGSLWDFAATACIFHELGLPATNFAGGVLDLNRKDSTFMNHEGVFFCNL